MRQNHNQAKSDFPTFLSIYDSPLLTHLKLATSLSIYDSPPSAHLKLVTFVLLYDSPRLIDPNHADWKGMRDLYHH